MRCSVMDSNSQRSGSSSTTKDSRVSAYPYCSVAALRTLTAVRPTPAKSQNIPHCDDRT